MKNVFVKTKKDRDQMLEHLKIQCITNDGMEVEVFDNMREFADWINSCNWLE